MSIISWIADVFWKRESIGDSPETPRGAPGTAMHDGWIYLPETNAKLTVPEQRYKTFDNMKLNVAVVGTGVRHMLTLFSGITWLIEPDPELPGGDDESLTDLCKEVTADLKTMNVSLEVVASRQALAHFDGFALQAWRAARKPDGELGIGSCDVRPPRTIERWDWDKKKQELRGVWQRDPSDGTEHYIEREFLIYTVDDAISDALVGTGVLRHGMTDAHTMGVYERYEAIGYESDMKGTPLARAPLARLAKLHKEGLLTEADFKLKTSALKKILENHVKTGKLSILLDSATYENPDGSPSSIYQYDLELVRGDQGTKYAAMDGAIDRRELRLARLLGVEHLFIGSSSKGGYSQSKDRSKSFGQMVTALAGRIAFDLRRDLIQPCLLLRGKDPYAPIKVTPDCTNLLDAAEGADLAWKMSQAGMVFTPDDPANNALRRRGKLPPMPKLDEQQLLAAQQAAGLMPPPPPPVDPNKIDPETGKPYKDPNPKPAPAAKPKK